MREGRSKGSRWGGRGVVASGALTGLSTLVVSAAAAASAAVLAQKFGRSAETDGFLAAYGAYLVLVLAAQAFRVVVLPELTRAAAAGRLGGETVSYGLALALPAAPIAVLGVAFAGPLGDAITGSLPRVAAEAAADALVWLVPAAIAQLYAALAASALAALDDYRMAALGYAAGALAGLALFLALADAHGLVALAWAMLLNAGIAVAIPAWALARARRGLTSPGRLRVGTRLRALAQGAAVPVALQGLYVVALRFAADLGVGEVTSLSYAYLIASVLVAVTASSLSLVSSAPLTRRGLDAESAAAHVVHSSWLSLALVFAGAGVFALAGGRIASSVLGDAFAGEAGRDLGRLVVALAPWMVASVALSLTFPLLFVAGRARALIPLALAALGTHALVTWGLREALELPGIALALALSTLAVAVALMAALSRRMVVLALPGLGRLTLFEAALGAASFGLLSLAVGGLPAALAGLALYAVLLALLRPRGLRDAWTYVRALH